MKAHVATLASLLGLGLTFGTASAADPGTQAGYLALTTKHGNPPPFGAARFTWGARERVEGLTYHWWQLDIQKDLEASSVPLVQVRGLTDGVPLESATNAIRFDRYLVRFPETGEVLEYRDAQSKHALLPGWSRFADDFLPRRSWGSLESHGAAGTATLLGHVLTLHHARTNAAWEPWPEARALVLERELLVGTARSFKDSEGHRLPQQPQRQNYTYVPFTADDYRTMIEAGINTFIVTPKQEPFVRGEPVFYLRDPGGEPRLRLPADLYRANYLGAIMFIDEPTSIMIGDTNIHRTLRYFSDAAAVIQLRTRALAQSAGEGAFRLESQLLRLGVNLGAMRLEQPDFPSWETFYETAFYQMSGGANGIVHEGRYQLGDFDRAVERFTGAARKHTARELLLYHFAFLRGAARAHGKYWGTSIYGQCDPAISPEAVRLAYDEGARYVWFWTSDHDHHLPWPEQLELARTLRRHVESHPRASIIGPPPKLDVAIVIPSGYFLSLDNLWWVRVMDKEGANEASQRYRRLMKRALTSAHECLDRGQSFDFVVDTGQPIRGYRHTVHLTDAE